MFFLKNINAKFQQTSCNCKRELSDTHCEHRKNDPDILENRQQEQIKIFDKSNLSICSLVNEQNKFTCRSFFSFQRGRCPLRQQCMSGASMIKTQTEKNLRFYKLKTKKKVVSRLPLSHLPLIHSIRQAWPFEDWNCQSVLMSGLWCIKRYTVTRTDTGMPVQKTYLSLNGKG